MESIEIGQIPKRKVGRKATKPQRVAKNYNVNTQNIRRMDSYLISIEDAKSASDVINEALSLLFDMENVPQLADDYMGGSEL